MSDGPTQSSAQTSQAVSDVQDDVTASADGSENVITLSKREQTKVANRNAILEAAREVFAEYGYGATTVRDIIRRTGLASGTFYNYYKSKEEVFEALSDANARLVRPLLREERLNAENFEQFARGTFRTFFSFVVDNERSFDVMRSNTGSIRVRMDTPEIVAGFDELRDDIVDAIEQGMLPKVDPEFLCGAMVGIAFEIGDRLSQREKPDVEAASNFATALLMNGIPTIPTLD
jgi:AcrR family transcriptional regulator